MSKGPIVIGGSPRSGTTLVLSLLSSHPDLCAIPFETYRLCPSVYQSADGSPGNVDLEGFQTLIGSAWNKRWVEKTPLNVRNIGGILASIPEAQFIHTVRNPKDLAISKYPGQSNYYMLSIPEMVRDIESGLEWAEDERVYTLRYEQLVGQFEEEVRRLGEFLGLDDVSTLLAYPEFATIQMAQAWTHPAKPVHAGAVDQWSKLEHYDRIEELMNNEDVVALLERLGY